MYTPLQPAIPSAYRHKVSYVEWSSGTHLASLVHCFWELRSIAPLKQTFSYLALPDACIDIIFDVSETPEFEGALIMTPNTTATTIALKTPFSYVGIRLLPGVWAESPGAIIGESLFVQTLGLLDLTPIRQQLAGAPLLEKRGILEQLVSGLAQEGIISKNERIQSLFAHPDAMTTVEAARLVLGYSRRHVQRMLREQVGYSPHDFLKVIRFQRSLHGEVLRAYADQPHYIREFKCITGMTPGAYAAIYT
jgi:AraC-like DNA-binding protein